MSMQVDDESKPATKWPPFGKYTGMLIGNKQLIGFRVSAVVASPAKIDAILAARYAGKRSGLDISKVATSAVVAEPLLMIAIGTSPLTTARITSPPLL